MTTPNDIANRACRLIGVAAAGESLSSEDATIAHTAFTALLDDLLPDLIGISVAEGYDADGNEHLLVDASDGALTVTLPATPADGMRVQITDVADSFAAANVTLARNGRLLEGAAANQTLSTDGLSKTWMYRGDTGNWHLLSPLARTDTLPFPARYEQGLAAMLAVLLAPEFGMTPSPVAVAMAEAGRRQLEARYLDTASLEVDRAIRWVRSATYTGEE